MTLDFNGLAVWELDVHGKSDKLEHPRGLQGGWDVKTLLFAFAAGALIANLHLQGVMTQVAPVDRFVRQLLVAMGLLG